MSALHKESVSEGTLALTVLKAPGDPPASCTATPPRRPVERRVDVAMPISLSSTVLTPGSATSFVSCQDALKITDVGVTNQIALASVVALREASPYTERSGSTRIRVPVPIRN